MSRLATQRRSRVSHLVPRGAAERVPVQRRSGRSGVVPVQRNDALPSLVSSAARYVATRAPPRPREMAHASVLGCWLLRSAQQLKWCAVCAGGRDDYRVKCGQRMHERLRSSASAMCEIVAYATSPADALPIARRERRPYLVQ